jgi:hypothetical protein
VVEGQAQAQGQVGARAVPNAGQRDQRRLRPCAVSGGGAHQEVMYRLDALAPGGPAEKRPRDVIGAGRWRFDRIAPEDPGNQEDAGQAVVPGRGEPGPEAAERRRHAGQFTGAQEVDGWRDGEGRRRRVGEQSDGVAQSGGGWKCSLPGSGGVKVDEDGPDSERGGSDDHAVPHA